MVPTGGQDRIGLGLPNILNTEHVQEDTWIPFRRKEFRLPFWVIFLLLSVPASAWAVRDWLCMRVRVGQCRECNYNLTGNISGICPECGTPIPDEIKEKTDHQSTKQ